MEPPDSVADSASMPRDLFDDDLRAKAMEIHRRLGREYGIPIPYFHRLNATEELVSSFLNHRTKNADAHRAFEALRARFPTWDAVVDADPADVETTIRGVRWPEMKAARLQAILQAVRDRTGGYDLSFLGDMPVPEARAWLEELPGVGPKTSAAVLSFSTLRRPALPVDSHHHRVAQRVGLIPATMTVGPSHAVLAGYMPTDWDAQAVYDHHQVFMRHGQRVCHWRGPTCGRCAILDLCPTGAHRMKGRA